MEATVLYCTVLYCTVLPRARCNPAWFTSLMLKKRVAALDGEVRADYVTAAKQSVLDYILLEVRSWW